MGMFFSSKKSRMPRPDEALPGRQTAMRVGETHFVSGHRITPPFPDGMQRAMFGMGCFWGAERKFWEVPGVYATAVGYAGGFTPNPTYEEVCSGMTGHNEVVLVVYDPGPVSPVSSVSPARPVSPVSPVSYDRLLAVFWESHDPTQGMRQGNDAGTQYRSGIYAFDAAQLAAAEASKAAYGKRLAAAGYGPITTEVISAPAF
jgi:peptide-methionine (S)-S-oxide reductase